MARDYIALWDATGTIDLEATQDGDTAHDGDAGSEGVMSFLFGGNPPDAIFYEPKTDWKATDRVNFEDFNAVETNTATLRWYLELIQYAIPAITTKTDRGMSWIDFLTSINRIEDNLETIRANFVTPAGYPGAESWDVGDGFDWNDMNRLEENIRLLWEYAHRVFDSFVYCGTINAGYERGAIPYVL